MSPPNDNLRYDMARIEAKVDMILQHLMSANSEVASPTPTEDINISELALLRGMTTKQHCVLQCVMVGMKNLEIADIMGIGENTVKLHVRAVCKKIGVKTRGQAATIASDIFRRADPDEYERLSGGIPITWAKNYEDPDPFAPIYANTLAQGDDEEWAS